MRYQIEWSPWACKFLHKLEKHTAGRILAKLDAIKGDPFRHLEHYEGQGHKLRIGNYRMLLDIDLSRKMIFIRVFDKRGRIYK